MLITFITTEIPSLKKGAPVRIYNLIKQAVRQGTTVDLITLVEPGERADHLRNELGVRKVISVPRIYGSILTHIKDGVFSRIPPYFSDHRRSKLSDFVTRYVKEENPDIIQLELLQTYYAVAPIIPAIQASRTRVILDAHNFEYKAFIDAVSTFSGAKYVAGLYIAPRMLAIEQAAALAVDHVFTCSEIDKEYFAHTTSPTKITVIPNGVDCSLFVSEPLVLGHTLIFAGGMYYPPNDDALRFYFHHIHPLIKKAIPDVKITVLGGEPNVWLKRMIQTDTSIVAPGLVPDVRAYLRSARVCISPMRKGSGTSLKLLEYMGSGKPVVTTSVGARGIECTNGHDLLVADTAVDFANALITLLQNDTEASRLGQHARETVVRAYDWKKITEKMIGAYRSPQK